MIDGYDPFASFREEPVFVLTGDQDWCPDWALDETFAVVRSYDLPYHLFMTNRSDSIESARAAGTRVSLGIHPNFLAGSSHGDAPAEVIDHCARIVPTATTFRCHAFHEDIRILLGLAERGFTTDSNLLGFLQPGLTPLIHGAGQLRLPVFLEDHTFFSRAGPDLDLRLALVLVMTPGLKIFNFHPAHVAINTPSLEFYDSHRGALYASAGTCDRFAGRGTGEILVEIVEAVHAAGYRFTSFPELAERAHEALAREFSHDLYGWLRR